MAKNSDTTPYLFIFTIILLGLGLIFLGYFIFGEVQEEAILFILIFLGFAILVASPFIMFRKRRR